MNVQLLIGNSDLDATGGRRFERKNPVTGTVAASAAAGDVRRCMMRLKCRSVASKAPATAAFGERAAIAEFTDLRWMTIEGRQRYPY